MVSLHQMNLSHDIEILKLQNNLFLMLMILIILKLLYLKCVVDVCYLKNIMNRFIKVKVKYLFNNGSVFKVKSICYLFT